MTPVSLDNIFSSALAIAEEWKTNDSVRAMAVTAAELMKVADIASRNSDSMDIRTRALRMARIVIEQLEGKPPEEEEKK